MIKINHEQFDQKTLVSVNGKRSILQEQFLEQYGENSFYYELASFIALFLNENNTIEAFSSGSTGTPKKIELKKAYMKNSAYKTLRFLELKPNDSALLCMPLQFIAGKMMVVRALLGNLDLIVVPPCVNPYLNIKDKITFSAITPMQALSSLENPATKNKILAVTKTIIGGGPISKSLENLLKNAEHDFYSSYGMTETVSHIALCKINQNTYPCFKVLDQVEIGISTQNTLTIKSDVCDGILYTNDIVQLLDNKHFIVLGRLDNIINSGGIKIMPEKIEKILSSYLKCDFAISYIEDSLLGQKVVLIVTQDVSEDDLNKAYLHLDKYEKPKEVIKLQNIPKTKTQKIDRFNLVKILNNKK